MADLELTIPCRTALNTTGLVVMWALWPVWALLAPLCIVATVIAVAISPIIFPPSLTLTLICLSASILALGILLTGLCEDDLIYVSKDGLSFPVSFLPRLRFRRHRLWSDLVEADLRQGPGTPPGSESSAALKLLFKSGGALSLPVGAFSRSDLEQLFLGIEMWGRDCTRSTNCIEYQRQLQNENKGIEKLSYTQLWEEELSRRYTNTLFVPLEPGSLLRSGQLKILRQLSFGGLSAIYLARWREKDSVVLKEAVVPAFASAQARRKAEEHFLREAEFLTRLKHERIAAVLDHFVEDGRNYLMLEYISGQDLRQYIGQNGPQSEERVLIWGKEIADILQYLHEQIPPIIHRDLTPDNLMLGRDGTISLIDFGAANELLSQSTGTLVGKQAYMAPEQLRGKATRQSDLYGLGATLYFLLTACDPVPLSVSHPRHVMADISPELDDLVALLTSFAESDRADSAKSVASTFEEISRRRESQSCAGVPGAASDGKETETGSAGEDGGDRGEGVPRRV